MIELGDGSKVELPVLDGILERGLLLVNEWFEKNPGLDSLSAREPALENMLMLVGIQCADVMRILEGFEKADIKKDVALKYAHSHFLEILVRAGICTLLAMNTWDLEKPTDSPETAPSFRGLTLEAPGDSKGTRRVRLTEEELRKSSEYAKDFPKLIGPEATEHLLQAVLAYDRWTRKQHKEK